MFTSPFSHTADTPQDSVQPNTPVPTTQADSTDDPLQWGGMTDVDKQETDASTLPPSPVEEKAGPDRTAELQAMAAEIREATEHIITEPHPEIEREDTAEKAHERGEL